MDSKKETKAIFFDLGGVIVDLDWKLCVNNFKEIGVPNMDDLISTTLQRGFILDYELGLITAEEFRDKIRENALQPVTDEQIDYAWTSLLVSIPPAKLDLLIKLKKKYKVYMLSNTNTLSYQYCLDNMFNVDGHSVNEYFDKCFLSFQMHLNKPNADIFEAVLADRGLIAEECLFLDDGIHNVETAAKIGFKTMFVEPYSELKPEVFGM